jgi:hypothetical protein
VARERSERVGATSCREERAQRMRPEVHRRREWRPVYLGRTPELDQLAGRFSAFRGCEPRRRRSRDDLLEDPPQDTVARNAQGMLRRVLAGTAYPRTRPR